MNVTYHLHKLGKDPALITRVGIDEKGAELTRIFTGHGVCTDHFQQDNEHETGKVFAQPGDNHEMVYDIVMPVAWDFIEWQDAYTGLVADAGYFVFGSLAARSETSRNTLLQILEAAPKKVFDINLRAPHYNRPILEELLRKTDVLKLNLAELELLAGWFSGYTNVEDGIRLVAERFGLSTIVVTMGGDGAILFIDGKIYRHPGFKVSVKDTVGSGDAFLAGLLSKLMDRAGPAQALEFANGLGAFIAGETGACPEYDPGEVSALMQDKTSQVLP